MEIFTKLRWPLVVPDQCSVDTACNRQCPFDGGQSSRGRPILAEDGFLHQRVPALLHCIQSARSSAQVGQVVEGKAACTILCVIFYVTLVLYF
jgi:hypothetical protein